MTTLGYLEELSTRWTYTYFKGGNYISVNFMFFPFTLEEIR